MREIIEKNTCCLITYLFIILKSKKINHFIVTNIKQDKFSLT